MQILNTRVKQRLNLGCAAGLLLLVLYAVFGTSVFRAGKVDASPILPIGTGTTKPGLLPALSISLNGENPLHHECGDWFEDPGATAVNSAGENVFVQVSGTLNLNVTGNHTLTYTAVEGRESVSIQRTVMVVDTSPPVVRLLGSNPTALACGANFEDPGWLGMDACDREVPVVVSGTVNSDSPGTYTITYTATDSRGNTGTAERRVVVGSSDEDPPTITVNDKLQMTTECGEVFTDPGATALTACSGSVIVEASGIVDVRTLGDYVVIYRASAGEAKAEKARLVVVVDTTPPIISLQGDDPLVITLNQPFVDPGAMAFDGCAGRFEATSSGTVDTKTVGFYTLTYTARDPSGNEAIQVTRTVKVVDKVETESPSLLRFHSLLTPASLELLFRMLDSSVL